MRASTYSLMVHGVGEQPPTFSDYAQRKLAGALAPADTLYAQPVHWAPVLDKDEAVMSRSVKARGSKMNMTQRLVVGTLADALCFANRQPELLAVFDRAEARLRAPRGLVICAHSLGVVLAINWLRARPSVRVDRFLTFGTNLQLFNMGAEGHFDCPHQLRAPGVWTNYFYDSDMLGWPIRGWIPQAVDVEVPKPFWSISTLVPGLAHNDYWGSGSFWTSQVAPTILGA